MYINEIRKRISDLEKKIENRDAQIASMIEKNNHDKLRLSKLKLLLDAKISEEKFRFAKERPKSPKRGKNNIQYMSLSDCDNIGLYNKVVLFPVAKCKLHNCYLDYKDVRKRNCAMRLCKHLEWVQDELTD
jgi:hypothetical protein|nr:MAG TPA: hypothetical protein [Caudoviricetes sp.]